MKIVTFNIQNLFHRDKSLVNIQAGNTIINWLSEMDRLMRKYTKTSSDLDRIKELSFLLGFEKMSRKSYAVMRRRGGELFFRGCHSSGEMMANSLTDWNGWVPLQTIPIDTVATQNKARVIAEVNADFLLLQEIEERASLSEFNQEFLPRFNCEPFRQNFIVQGNDKRGQDIGILKGWGFEIQLVRSHSCDLNFLEETIFNKDFVEYEVRTANENSIWILATHLQEQTEDKEISDDTREEQAEKIAEVYNQLYSEGKKHIAVVGTLNALSYCYSLAPLLLKTNLKDITKHPSFNVDFDKGKDAGYHSLGAYQMGVNIKRKDYLLLSPELFTKVKSSGLNKKGIWSEKQPMWSYYPSMNQKNQAASEHPLIWREIDI